MDREIKRLINEPASWGMVVNGEGIYFVAEKEKAARINSEKRGVELVPVDGYWLVKNRETHRVNLAAPA